MRRLLLVLAFASACNAPEAPAPDDGFAYGVALAPNTAALGGDVLHVSLRLDVREMTGVARYQIDSRGLSEVWLEVDELRIDSVLDRDGAPIDHLFENAAGHRRLVVPAQGDETRVHITYAFFDAEQNASGRGYSPRWRGATTWPVHCSSLFPCHSSPADGMRYSLDVVGEPAVFMPELTFDAPSYMLSFATGDFEVREATPTSAGTRVRFYLSDTPPPNIDDALEGVRDAFDWYERTLGPYHFGDVVGGVMVHSPVHCMEHHPFWHCVPDMKTNRHEAAHGWFGNGVRLGCWEDIAVSEAFAEYLTRRVDRALRGDHGLFAVDGAQARPGKNGVWQPHQCSLIGPSADWMGAYTNGPSFLMEIANALGAERLDDLIARFYRRQVGHATRLEDFLDFLKVEADFDALPLAHKWLI